jgi:hypothetical protein
MIGRSRRYMPQREEGSLAERPSREMVLKVAREFCKKYGDFHTNCSGKSRYFYEAAPVTK